MRWPASASSMRTRTTAGAEAEKGEVVIDLRDAACTQACHRHRPSEFCAQPDSPIYFALNVPVMAPGFRHPKATKCPPRAHWDTLPAESSRTLRYPGRSERRRWYPKRHTSIQWIESLDPDAQNIRRI